ncbi:MAG: AAA family ATPase [Candidatus Spechtbacterales bacterium]
MAVVLGIANQKGGVGKTATAVNTSTYLAALGKKVLLVDLDPQANATSGLGVDPRKVDFSVYHAINNKVPTAQAIRNTELFGYHLLPSSFDLAGASVELVNMKNREFRLNDALTKVRHEYDYIVIDSPPSLGLLTINGLVASDEILIPVQCEYYALEGLAQLLETVDIIKNNLGKDIGILGAVLTMYDKRNKLDRSIAKEVRRNFPGYVFDTVIPRNVDIAEAPGHGKTIFQFNPFSQGALAYKQLAEEVIKRCAV